MKYHSLKILAALFVMGSFGVGFLAGAEYGKWIGWAGFIIMILTGVILHFVAKKITVSNRDEIDIDALEAKRKRVTAKSQNPANSAYRDKLSELLNLQATARDNFVNWITGLATGAMILAFSNLASASDNLLILLTSGVTLFLCILSAMAFKILLEVRFSTLELEVSLLRNIWEGHDIRAQLLEMMQNGEEATEEAKQKFLRNMDESLNYLDEGNLERLKKRINFRSKLWVFSYWLTLGLFVIGVGLMVFYFLRPICFK